MNVSNCRSCGRLFNVLNDERICPECQKKLDDKFMSVKEYLEEHRGASIDEVSKEMDVSVKQIKQWIREERLTLSENSLDGIECENCGKLIKTGRFCEDCKKSMASTLEKLYQHKGPDTKPTKPTRDGTHMRFL